MPTTPYRNPLTEVLFERAREFVGLYDVAQGWFSRVNPAGYQLLGYPSAEALYADPARTLRAQPLTPAEWATLHERVLREGHYEEDMEVRRQAGGSFWAHVEVTDLLLDGHQYLLVRLTDTDRLHTAEHYLAQSVGRFEAVFAHATIGIIVCNRPGAIVLANEQAHRQFGYPPLGLLATDIEALVPGTDGAAHARLRAFFNARPQVRAMGEGRNLLARRRDGSVFPVEISLSYFHQDEELYVVAYIIDVTVKREAERELLAQHQHVAALNAALEQKVADRTHALATTLSQLEKRTTELAQALATEQELGELKSRFVSMASHEFRTPLTAVLTSAALVEKYPLTEQQPQRLRHLARIRTSVKNLTDILEEFLSVGKLEAGRLTLRPEQVRLPALLQEAVAEVQGLRRPGQRIELHLDSPDPLWLDGSLLRKILVNLLSNALKYSGHDTTVTVRGTAHHGQLTLQVQDHGMGIAPEDQEHLFERFFRARNAANVPGTGLGLYIITKYLELMGGTISLQSTLAVGTTFTLTLPYENHSTN